MSLAWADYEGVPRPPLFVTTSLALLSLFAENSGRPRYLSLIFPISQQVCCIDRAVLVHCGIGLVLQRYRTLRTENIVQ